MSKPILAAILSCIGTELTDKEKYLFSEYNPLGITLFSRNIENKEQVKKLTKSIKEVIGRDDVIIAIDQEGGRVNRLEKLGYKYASAEDLARKDIKYTLFHSSLIAQNCSELGINLNYAPVIDRKNNLSSKVLEGRCFSNKDEIIVKYAKALADNYMQNGICPCIKHIPGHFSVDKDPHLQIIKSDMSVKEIKEETKYIKEFADYPMAMTSHIILNNIDSNNPTTMSEKVISELIRGYIDFKGMLISDAIDMRALRGNIIEKTKNILSSGVDAICYCSGIADELKAICEEKIFLTEKALNRFAKIKKIIHNTKKWEEMSTISEQYNNMFSVEFNHQYSYDATEVLEKMLNKGEN